MRAPKAALVFLIGSSSISAQEAYLDRLSAAPGDTVNVHVSGDATISVWRSHFFNEDTLLLQAGPFSVVAPSNTAGSYAAVPTGSALEITGDLSLEAWVRPVSGGSFHGILSKYSVPNDTAYNVYLMPSGQLSFYLSDDGVFSTDNRTLTTDPLPMGAWTHVVATYDGAFKRIYLDGQLDVEDARTGAIFDNSEPVRVGAYGSNGQAAEFFNGQIDSPAVYDRVLTPAEIQQRFNEQAAYTTGNPGVLAGAVAQWNFGELDGTTLADATGNGHDLTLVNYGTRGVPGPSPRLSPGDSHSIRFSEEDLHDLDWPSPYSFVIPPTWESGMYYVQAGSRKLPLIVKPAPAERGRIAVLAATNTWHAYNTWTGNSLYSTHLGGAIAYYVNMLQPNSAVCFSCTPGGGYQHLVDAERYLYKWLDDNNYPFDLYSDLDLHQDPDLLDPYAVLFLNGHSEYWSHEMVDHVETFQAQGGSIINLSGNTMWSLVTFNDDFTVIEGRKHPHSAGTIPADERWHSQAGGVLGGTLRCIGRPEHAVIGTGYGILTSSPNFGWARVLKPGHWAFKGTGVSLHSVFGETAANGGRMFGHESDVVLPQWTPANTVVLARAEYPVPVGSLNISNCQSRSSPQVQIGGDIVYFDHPGGGGVFGIPSVAAGSSLIGDPVASRMVDNVLRRFLGKRPKIRKVDEPLRGASFPIPFGR